VRELLTPLGLTEEPPTGGAARERWESLLALVELAEELAATVEGADLAQYVVELDMRARAQHPPTVEGVTLASLHAAKGLEWDAVFLVGLVEGTLPILHADGNDAAIEEERRLLYVGVTRARQFLSLSWALTRSESNRRPRRRSRFLYGLIPPERSLRSDYRDDHPTSRLTRARQQAGVAPTLCRVCGRQLVDAVATKLGRCSNCPADVDEDLLARLKEWRAKRARMLKVPAYVVFTDATLTAIAEQRPTDSSALVSIAGIGASKLEKFGSEVLALLAGTDRSGDM
jgi:DNA helicase-2/ATP-dependent DNA helicase PcrA